MGPQYAMFMVTILLVVWKSATSDTSTTERETLDCKLSDKCGAEALAVLMIILVIFLCLFVLTVSVAVKELQNLMIWTPLSFIPDSSYW